MLVCAWLDRVFLLGWERMGGCGPVSGLGKVLPPPGGHTQVGEAEKPRDRSRNDTSHTWDDTTCRVVDGGVRIDETAGLWW